VSLLAGKIVVVVSGRIKDFAVYQNYKVVVVTPAGREKYLRILRAYIKESPLVDEHHLLMNPIDDSGCLSQQDMVYINSCREERDCFVIDTADIPSKIVDPAERRRWRISRLFRNCLDPDVIYIFMSDDIVWVAPDAFELLLQYRTMYEDYFLVFPNVINTSMCSYFHQQAQYLGAKHGMAIRSNKCPVSNHNAEFSEDVHRSFIKELESNVHAWALKDFTLNLDNRREIMPLQVFSFFGKECAYFEGIVDSPFVQSWLCSAYCHEWDMWNGFCGGARFAHFAHRMQEQHLLSTDILDRYTKLAPIRSASFVEG